MTSENAMSEERLKELMVVAASYRKSETTVVSLFWLEECIDDIVRLRAEVERLTEIKTGSPWSEQCPRCGQNWPADEDGENRT